MSQLEKVENLKIPYPVEGVIRTAQLDDTVAPENSVQLAVNMNFDRVGAVQTRLGVTEYADALDGPVKNFGTLRNSIRPNGYDSLVELGEQSELTTTVFRYSTMAKVDDDHVIIFWSGVDSDGFAQVFETSLITGGLTPVGSPIEFDAANGTNNKCIRIDGSHFLNVWTGTSSDAFAQVFEVDLTTFAVTALGTPLEFDTTNGAEFALAQIDSSRFICFYDNQDSADGIATVLAVNLSTWAVTEPGSPTTFATGDAFANSCIALGNGTHFVNFWNDSASGDGYAQTFSVNLSTWAITAIGSPFVFDASGANAISIVSVGDGQNIVAFFASNAGNGVVRAFNVNPSTYAITAAGASLTFQSGAVGELAASGMGDGQHFFAMWSNSSVEYAQLFSLNTSTFAITAVGSPLNMGSETSSQHTAVLTMSLYRVLGIWRDGTTFGQGIMFKTEGDLVSGRYLYAGVGDEVSNWDGANWTVQRSGLAEVSKPRFSQYLNYLWMVNGNESIGGDPVATSSGGAFGTDLVPEGFPPGDFIHAGFEGRVWVADKQLGAIFYTDIVQFTPPDVYTLSYDPDVNFITTIAPQTGQNFTAMYRVPRALLIFTEDSIYRIYGASSIDAYPAYNVGTYSQESIVETKTGIFFHHSSGFYQFDYGGQPVEISRRIIDFVKAIPRSSYDDIVGVYDGFDAVEWSIGSVTVEGVVYSSCVVRYTISTQVWTVYDYKGNVITAMILFDDGTNLNHLMGTSAGLVGAMDTGTTDFDEPFYYEYIDRWRSYTDVYYLQKSFTEICVYSENAAGANLMYQVQKSGPNAWKPVGTVSESNTSLITNTTPGDFDVSRLRIAGTTKGAPVVIHGIEIVEMTIKGKDEN